MRLAAAKEQTEVFRKIDLLHGKKKMLLKQLAWVLKLLRVDPKKRILFILKEKHIDLQGYTGSY